MTVVRWKLEDPAISDTYTFAINPDALTPPAVETTVNFTATTAVDGVNLFYEGRPPAQQVTFSGTILDAGQHDAFVRFARKRRQVKLTDDTGAVLWIKITSYKPVRVRSGLNPNKKTYTIEAFIVNVP